MKKILPYLTGLIVAIAVLGFVAMFVLPTAMCMCTYNEIKSFLVFPVSPIAGLAVVLLTHLSVEKGKSYKRAFFQNLFYLIVPFILFGFLIEPIANYIEAHDIPIFQPEFRVIEV